MQGGGQFYGGADGGYARRRVQEQVEHAQTVRKARRRRGSSHRQHAHFGWLHFGHRKHTAEHQAADH
jgi:hypothetical protein